MAEQSDAVELKLAFFGESGSGKTCLASSFYGHQQAGDFVAQKGYSLLAADPRDDEELLARYNLLSVERRFPDATNIPRTYSLDLLIHELREQPSALRIKWFDYPGEWWRTWPGSEEASAQDLAFNQILETHVAFVLLDGSKYREQGAPYVKTALSNISNQITRQRRQMGAQNLPLGDYPQEWVIALSKADLLPGLTAKAFYEDLMRSAGQELKRLMLDVDRAPANGRPLNYMLLSSVSSANGSKVDSLDSLGLELITPVALLSAMKMLGESISGQRRDDFWQSMWEGFLGASTWFLKNLHLFEETAEELHPKLRPILQFLRAAEFHRYPEATLESIRKEKSEAIQRRDAVRTTYLAMEEEIQSEDFKRVYFRPTLVPTA